ncbi:hypothetical protein ALP8811_03110 [Aliiroseovarius pelagivivens]|uniref:ParB/Sulfiredoxin domain-containing protein n=1 Tax=Aliiroseovarius pelagivivens TaxID=1639690 RepID=A0A2R8ASY7_9RHOB|nr:hypothetical protein [Aliiroseovarius pelagivivens]SPF79172.1 hypothetical protein ALP8811_03110 [Aliiroseovarius pelagivivens]
MSFFEQLGVERGETRKEAFDRLSLQHEEGLGQRAENIRTVVLSSLSVEPLVFQHREDGPGDMWGHELHLDNLKQAIKREPGHRLDPIVIWQCGPDFIVIDGHFRVEAYRQYARDKKTQPKRFKVPCQVFHGGPLEALDRSITLNKKVSSPLTKTELSNAAWQRICLSWDGEGWSTSKKQLIALGLVADNTIARMRRTFMKLLKSGKVTTEDCHGMTWQDAEAALKGIDGEDVKDWWDDDERWDAGVQELADRLSRTFGSILREAPLFTLAAFERYSPQLVAAWEEYMLEERELCEDF